MMVNNNEVILAILERYNPSLVQINTNVRLNKIAVTECTMYRLTVQHIYNLYQTKKNQPAYISLSKKVLIFSKTKKCFEK